MRYFGALAILVALTALLSTHNVDAACGYKACNAGKANMVNVHLVPHSHDDVGWLKTVDQYYYGSKNGIQHAGVEYILDSVVQELLKDTKRKFIYVESAFFFKWYKAQTADLQKSVKKLIDEGRLEIAGGAWSMNDEAAVHYQSVIDQFSLGLKALSDTFGTCARPHIGWQIDPFGHSREMASIFAQMGYDGEFFARMDWVEKNARMNTMNGEMIWKASDSLGERAELFTGVLYNHYSAPPGFCFDILCSDDPIIDGVSYDNNVKDKVDTFISYITNMTKHYRASDLLVPMGDDFQFENAAINFKNIDKLIKYVNERQALGTKINLFYSTPACYLNALHENVALTWPNKTQDFFPYSSDYHSYWTGYFSSRPTQKRFERDGNHFLQVTKQLTAFANLTGTDITQNLDNLRSVMGIMQHHDAITGTEKQRVAYDYDRLLTDAIVGAETNTRLALQKLTNLTTGEFRSCLELNISVCEFTRAGANNLVVTLFNPLTHSITEIVRVPAKNESYEVTDEKGFVVASKLMPVASEVLALKFRENSTQHELVFAAHVEKLASFYIKVKPTPKQYDAELETNNISMPKRFQQLRQHLVNTQPEVRAVGDIIVQNSLIKLTFSSTGHLTNVEMNGISESIRQDFYYYKGANNASQRSSGAYIFRPNGTEIQLGAKVDLKVYTGTLVQEVHQRFDSWLSQVIRIYDGINRVEFEWLVGPIPIGDNVGKEVVTRFTSNLNTNNAFWTDSNGREMLQRVRNEREYFKPNMTEQISGNYYPITTRIQLINAQRRLTLFTDRAQGGSSPKNGALELMLHRRLLRDDGFGVGEALNETAFGQGLIARGKVHLVLSQATTPLVYDPLTQQELHLPFWKFFSNSSKATNKVPPKLPNFSSLPLAVQVLTLEPYSNTERLIRFESFMNKNETSTITTNIRTIFDALGGESIRETTLDGSMKLSDMKRFKFTPDGVKPATKAEYYTSKHTPMSAVKKDAVSKFDMTLDPMQIRTFIITWK